MSRRTLVLHHFHRLGLATAKRLLKLSYAIFLSDFLKRNKKTPRFVDRFGMYAFLVEALRLKEKQLQYLEFGVFEGASMQYWLGANRHTNSAFYGFDSFEGLPEDWFPGMGKGAFNLNGKLPDITDGRARFIKGWFNETLPGFSKEIRPEEGAQIILHLDADLYSSTYYVLNQLFFLGYIRKGTLLIFDEAIVASIADTEFRAFFDFVQALQLSYEVLAIGKFEMAIRIQ